MRSANRSIGVCMLLLFGSLCCNDSIGQSAPATAKPDPQKVVLFDATTANAKYKELSAEVKAGNYNIDWFALRLAARLRNDQAAGQSMRDEVAQKNVYAALQAKNYADALKDAQALIDGNIALGEPHMIAAFIYKQLDKTDDSDREKQIGLRIAKSIMSPGDGKSAETAWLVVWPDEEYYIFHLMGLQPKQQSLVIRNGHEYDQMVVTDPDTKADTTFWFNTDTDFLIMGQALGKQGNKK